MRMGFRYILAVAAAGLIAAFSLTSVARELDDAGRQYVQFEPLVTPVYIGGDVAGLVGIRIAVAVESRAHREQVGALRPRLTDAYLHALSDHARLYLNPGEPVDLQALHGALVEANEAAGAGAGELLLLETMAYRR